LYPQNEILCTPLNKTVKVSDELAYKCLRETLQKSFLLSLLLDVVVVRLVVDSFVGRGRLRRSSRDVNVGTVQQAATLVS